MPVIVTIKVGSPINEEDAKVLGSLAVAFTMMGAAFMPDPSSIPGEESEGEAPEEPPTPVGHLFGTEVN